MQRKPSDTENKLLLLHDIDRLGAVTAEQLLVFAVENDQMDYISLQLCLAELDDAGLLRKQMHALGTLYALTGKGHDALELFRKRVPHSRLASVDEAAAAWRQRFRREKQMLADFEKKADGEYMVHLRLFERNAELLHLDISVPTHDTAERFCGAWIHNATEVYAQIMHILGEEHPGNHSEDTKTHE